VRAVEDVSLDVAPGEVLGIAGPNGAGKSTLIAMLLGFLPPDEGEVRIDGLAPRAFVQREGIAYLPELMTLPLTWRTDDALDRMATLAGIPAAARPAARERVIEAMDIGEHRRKRLKALSKGNLQRVGLAQALLAQRRVAVFDEPTHGLDPVWTTRFRDLSPASVRRATRW
jgi:ABC-2 type transport system ATP-binding protein